MARRGPKTWGQEIVVERIGREGNGVWCGEIDLFALVDCVGCDFGGERRVAEE